MFTYQDLKKKPAVFHNFTWLKLKAFQALLPSFYLAYEDDLDARDAKRKQKRQRELGEGRRGAIKTMGDKLLFWG